MEHDYPEIYRRAAPYLNTRHNDIHVPIAYRFAKRLLACYPEANREVVLPAVLLHDVGWKMVPEDQQLKAFGPKMQDAGLRRVHELEGARIAGEILAELGYDPALGLEIQTIIEGHDSRETPLSLNDQLVKDADKLWRFTQTAVEIDYHRFEIERGPYIEWLGAQIEGWFFTPEAARIARETLAEAVIALQEA